VKKMLLIAFAIVAMAGFANAQHATCSDGCSKGGYDSDGYYWFGNTCDATHKDCQVDRNNCGSIGNVCPSGYACSNSLCICNDYCGGDYGTIQPGANPANPPLTINVPLKLIPRKLPHLT